MISFELPEDLELARSLFQELASEIVAPAAKASEKNAALDPQVLNSLHQAGLVQAALDGDSERTQPVLGNCILLEELGRADAAIAVLMGATFGYVEAVSRYGTAQQIAALRQDWQGTSLRGGAVLAQEPGFGSELKDMRTRAVPRHDGYLLSGEKSFVPVAEGWDDFLVVARIDDGHAAFMVPKALPGMRLVAGAPTLGLRALHFQSVQFTDVALPLQARLGGEAGFDVQHLISASRLANAAILTGISRAVFEHVTPYTKDRVVHGTALARKQSVAFRLADMATIIPAMRWMVWRGAVALEKNGTAAREARLAQIYCAKQAFAFADEGVQLMGGHGYMKENPVERWFRDARTLSLLEGVTGI